MSHTNNFIHITTICFYSNSDMNWGFQKSLRSHWNIFTISHCQLSLITLIYVSQWSWSSSMAEITPAEFAREEAETHWWVEAVAWAGCPARPGAAPLAPAPAISEATKPLARHCHWGISSSCTGHCVTHIYTSPLSDTDTLTGTPFIGGQGN